MRRRALAALLLVLAGCAADGLEPAALQTGTTCAQCRMTVLDAKLASQIVAPGEEPKFFDDLGCLAAYLAAHPASGPARALVADHRTGHWADARDALYTRSESVATPMGSHFFAHADDASRAADPAVGDNALVPSAVVFGNAALPGRDR